MSVEEVALQHFATLGWEGVHCEWRVTHILTALLLHDVIWDPSGVPAAFIHPLQRQPLDLYSSDFARRRATPLCQRLSVIASYTREELRAEVASRWDAAQSYRSTMPMLATMDQFTRRQITAAAGALGGRAVASMLQVITSDVTTYAYGLPDLLLWRNDTEVCVT
jgi:fanconi-associated nuclease 1